jgi:hypothetical protein
MVVNWLKIGNSAYVCYILNQGFHRRHISDLAEQL